MRIILFLFFLSCLSTTGLTQSPLPKFGIYSLEEMEMKECSFDKEAEAVILIDEGISEYDEDHRLITMRRVRIKILNARGMDQGNIVIPFYSKDDFEIIQRIEGITYTHGGSTAFSNLDKKSVFIEKVNDRYSLVKFAMPNVKEGSIIEYKYESIKKHFGGLEDWRFQDELPTVKSRYKLQPVPNAEFRYVLSKKEDYDVIITPHAQAGLIYFEMNNIPGLRMEPYMDSPQDYLQKVEFQLSGYRSFTGYKEKINTTWEEIARSCADDEDLGGAVRKPLTVPADLQVAVAAASTEEAKIVAVYDHIVKNYTWNQLHSKYATQSLKKVVESKLGTSGELNLVLVNYLQSFGIEALPLLAADRKYGRVLPQNPLLDRFNKTAVYVHTAAGILILDASDASCPPGLTPPSLLNTFALPVKRDNSTLVEIKSTKASFQSHIRINATLDSLGNLSGRAVITSDEYARKTQSEAIKENKQSYITGKLESPYEGVKIDSFLFVMPQNHHDSLVQHLVFHKETNLDGGYLLLQYNLFTGLSKSPFKAKERFTNVNFGYPYKIVLEERIRVPPSAVIESLPQNKTVKNYEGDISVTRMISKKGNELVIRMEFNQLVTHVSAADYPDLRLIYNKIVDMLNEPIAVKFSH